MHTTTIMDEVEESMQEKPGAQLAAVRQAKGYSTDYVAGKLHLRVRLIELLEADEYQNMPEPVFIKGYLRAYAKLLDVAPEPLLEAFNGLYSSERKLERALWQSRRETNRAEHAVRWLTALFALGVLIAVAVWWYKNKDNERIFPTSVSRQETSSNKSESEIRLTDLSKMRSLLSSSNQYNTLEGPGE
ncbi:helix-turn-helix domain-containing protein [Legionella nagasakiensis]|uniref:helix-turn-helix domain-containing protein n=1 Tax=Legionella nagasakiensis TaxID=535290 RepID=UPI0010564E40|nr:helix-turn-helix domain-containing protein [Legionella nagasakiensis]